MSITVPLSGFGGGGGTSLNFDVKAYPTEEALLASTPKENTIGIITENKITSWALDFTEPSAPEEGMVWITIGTESAVAFNILKKNAVQVYPISAKQYVGGAWVSVTAMSYQNGTWSSWWDGELFANGNQFESVTGGLKGYAYKTSTSGSSVIEPVLEIGSDEVVFKVHSSATSIPAGSLFVENPIDLTLYNKLKINVTQYSAQNNTSIYMQITAEKKNLYAVAAEVVITKTGEYELDISNLDGEYYCVILCASGYNKTIGFDYWKLER